MCLFLCMPLTIGLVMLLVWNLYLAVQNKTTIEFHEGVTANIKVCCWLTRVAQSPPLTSGPSWIPCERPFGALTEQSPAHIFLVCCGRSCTPLRQFE